MCFAIIHTLLCAGYGEYGLHFSGGSMVRHLTPRDVSGEREVTHVFQSHDLGVSESHKAQLKHCQAPDKYMGVLHCSGELSC